MAAQTNAQLAARYVINPAVVKKGGARERLIASFCQNVVAAAILANSVLPDGAPKTQIFADFDQAVVDINTAALNIND